MSALAKNIWFWSAWLGVFFIILWASTFAIDTPTGYTSEAGIGPATWPRAVTLSLIGLCALMVGISAALYQNARRRGLPVEAEAKASLNLPRLLLACAGLFAYYAGVLFIGIMPASLLAFLLYVKLCAAENYKILLPLGICLSVGLYSFFYYVAKIPLPTGVFGGMI